MKKYFLTLTLCILTTAAFAQKITVKSGSLDCLKNEKSVNIEFSYDNLRVGGMIEEDYIERKVAEKDKKEPGTGKEWVEQWKRDRGARFEPKFILLFNEYIEQSKFPIIGTNDGNLVMKADVIFLEPGFNVGVMRKNAAVTLRITIVDKATDEKKALVIIENASANDFMGTDFDSAYRIQESYAKAGREFAKFIIKKVK